MESVKDLIEDANNRKADQSARVQAYQKYAGAYFQDSADDDNGLGVRGNYGDGRMALQMVQNIEEQLDRRRGAPKLIKAMVDDIVSVRGVLPNFSVTPEDATPPAELMATKRTRAVRQWWHYSRMVLKQPRAAWSCATKGDACYVLNPRFPAEAEAAKDPFKPAGIYIDVIPVDTAFPRFKMGEDFDQLEDLYIITEITVHEAKRLYDYTPADDKPKVQVIVFYNHEYKRTVIGDREVFPKGMVEPVTHNLGFVPAEWHQNKPTDGRNAQADINDCVELETTMQRQFHVFGDAILWATYPTAVIEGKVAGDTLEYGPGAHVEMEKGGSFNLIGPQANVMAAQVIFQASQEAIMQQAGVSPVRMQGQIDRSNVTGRAVSAQMSPQEARLSAANERLAGSLSMLISKQMLMFYKLDGFKDYTMTLDAVPQDGQGKDTITPDDFGGWIANTVEWDSALHLNQHERLAMGLQMRKEGLYSGKKVLQTIGDNDPERTLREAEADQQQTMQRMMQMQQGAQPGGGQPGQPPGPTPPGSPQQPGGDPTAAAQQGMSLAAGGDGGTPGGGAPVQPGPDQGAAPLKQLSGFAPLAAPPGSPPGNPGPIDNPLPKVDAALAGIQLHGEVLQRYPIPGGVRVMLSDHRDIAAVKAALRAALPGLTLDVRVPPKTAPPTPQTASSNGNSRSK